MQLKHEYIALWKILAFSFDSPSKESREAIFCLIFVPTPYCVYVPTVFCLCNATRGQQCWTVTTTICNHSTENQHPELNCRQTKLMTQWWAKEYRRGKLTQCSSYTEQHKRMMRLTTAKSYTALIQRQLSAEQSGFHSQVKCPCTSRAHSLFLIESSIWSNTCLNVPVPTHMFPRRLTIHAPTTNAHPLNHWCKEWTHLVLLYSICPTMYSHRYTTSRAKSTVTTYPQTLKELTNCGSVFSRCSTVTTAEESACRHNSYTSHDWRQLFWISLRGQTEQTVQQLLHVNKMTERHSTVELESVHMTKIATDSPLE